MPKVQSNSEPKSSRKGRKSKSETPEASPPVRELLYPEPETQIGHLTFDLVKQFMGIQTPADDSQKKAWLADCHFNHDLCGPIKFTNNTANRPHRLGHILLLMQEILRGRWKLNGEPIIIGWYGGVLDGQHTMLALYLAVLAYRAAPELYPFWNNQGEGGVEPTIEKVVTYGISEDDYVVNTINTGIPRSDSDVLYRTYFQDKPAKDRKVLSRTLAYAVRFVWSRTGAAEAFAPRRTHAETIEFVDRHLRLLKAVEHIVAETGAEGKLSRYLSPGYAAGLMYLMAASSTDDGPKSYREAKSPGEDLINFSMWKDASTFWVQVAAGDKALNPLREAFAELANRGDGGGSLAERVALLVKAWLAYPKVSAADLELEYTSDSDGVKRLSEHPACGGIDLGPHQS